MGQLGRHSPDHAKTLSDHGVLSKLVHVLTTASDETQDSGVDLKTKTKRALKCILEKTLYFDALEPLLLQSTPPNILKYVMGQFSKILPLDVNARRSFVTCGGLQRVQEIVALNSNASNGNGLVGTKIGEYIRTINECYPEEIVRYYSPGYSTTLLDKVIHI